MSGNFLRYPPLRQSGGYWDDDNSRYDMETPEFKIVSVGDQYSNNQFQVKRKLGCGGFGTVWLAADKRTSPPRAVVLKFQARNLQTKEIELLSELSKRQGSERIARLLKAFDASGYQCLVLDAMWQPVTHLLFKFEWDFGSRFQILKHVGREVLLGLDFLKRQEVLHNDIRANNILVGFSEWPLDGLVGDGQGTNNVIKPPPPQAVSSPPVPGLHQVYPAYHSAPIDLVEGTLFDLSKVTVKISDFGFAHSIKDTNFKLISRDLCSVAPEICFGLRRGFTSDIWNYGTMLFQLVTYREFVDPEYELDGEGDDSVPRAMYRRVWETFGTMPTTLEASTIVKDIKGDLRTQRWTWNPLSAQLAKPLGGHQNVPEAFLDFLSVIMNPDPQLRPQASQLLTHRWITG